MASCSSHGPAIAVCPSHRLFSHVPGEGGPYQYFKLSTSGQLQSDDNRCVDAAGLTKGDQLKVTRCKADMPGQQWTWVVDSGMSGFLRNKQNSLCMELGPMTKVVMGECGRGCGQIWTVSKVDKGAPIEKQKSAASEGQGALVHSKQGGRVLCWVLTQPAAHTTKAVAVNNTWGRDCDILMFASTESHVGLHIVELDLGAAESRTLLWPKSQQMWMHLYSQYLNRADWFFKADDDTCEFCPVLHLRVLLACSVLPTTCPVPP